MFTIIRRQECLYKYDETKNKRFQKLGLEPSINLLYSLLFLNQDYELNFND